MLTMEVLKELLEKLHTRTEKIHDENGSNYIKGFIAGEIHMISFIIQEYNNKG